jgi:hypothetical protein
MAYKEVSRMEITEVIRRWQAGYGIREIPFESTSSQRKGVALPMMGQPQPNYSWLAWCS